MTRRCVALAAAAAVLAAASAQAFDQIRTTKTTLMGRVVSVTPVRVVIERGAAGLTEDVPVNEIIMIVYDDEPSPLKSTARSHFIGGRYEECLGVLEKLDTSTIQRPEIIAEVDYLTAYCQARIALGGGGDLAAARNAMAAFREKHPTSYHVVEAFEILGNLSVALQDYAKAEEWYATMAKAPWPDYQMRAQVARGRALLAQEKHKEAGAAFDQVLAMNVQGELADAQRMAANLGQARIMAATNRAADAIKAVNSIISRATPEQTELLAHAYNTLGTAQRLAGQPKEAVMAFLHTDILYHSVPEAHAEALYNLERLWEQLAMTERAAECRALLDQRYRNSPWAKRGG
jgi:tetratricopeptide (TPR) repeat protein